MWELVHITTSTAVNLFVRLCVSVCVCECVGVCMCVCGNPPRTFRCVFQQRASVVRSSIRIVAAGAVNKRVIL
jgi:hypothetical protein